MKIAKQKAPAGTGATKKGILLTQIFHLQYTTISCLAQ